MSTMIEWWRKHITAECVARCLLITSQATANNVRGIFGTNLES